ncbi:MAG: ribosome biogenesis GTP-binding protein YihA/YsxC [Bacteroidota bacterium]
MIIKTAEFIISNTDPNKAPTTGLPEFAFIGRSNVGKSSLINMLVNRKNLAKTSSTPGKTQTINHFVINNSWYVVDLPGYGYASVNKTARQAWPVMIENYIKNRETLQNTFVLIDSRLEPQANDLDFVNWIGKTQIPFSLVFTKIDKISKGAVNKTAEAWGEKLKKTWDELPPVFFTSAEKKTGREELLGYIEDILKK